MRFLTVFQASYKKTTFRASLFIGSKSYFLISIIYNLSGLVFNVFMSLIVNSV